MIRLILRRCANSRAIIRIVRIIFRDKEMIKYGRPNETAVSLYKELPGVEDCTVNTTPSAMRYFRNDAIYYLGGKPRTYRTRQQASEMV